MADWEQIDFDFQGVSDFQGSVGGTGMSDSTSKLTENSAVIKVFGIGGGGLNAVNNMIRSGLNGVEFFAANTDSQALASALPANKIRLG